MSDLTDRLRHDLAHRHDGGHTCMICEAADALDAAEAELDHLNELYVIRRRKHNEAATQLATAEAKLAAIDALHQLHPDGWCNYCLDWPCPTHLILHPEDDA